VIVGLVATVVAPASAELLPLQTLIDLAAPGDTILVPPGIYPVPLRFDGKDVTLRSTDGPEVTILDGDAGTTVNGPLLIIGPGGTLIGFTIRNGRINVGGGALEVRGVGSLVQGNIFRDNHASSSGNSGAASYGSAASPRIEGNTFRNNSCTGASSVGVVRDGISDLLTHRPSNSDFNVDGRLDFAAVQNDSNQPSTLGIFLGDGAGGFAAAAVPPVSVEKGLIAFVAGDFNNDARPDLAVLSQSAPYNVTVLLGDGQGGFVVHAPVVAGTDPANLATGDFNGDGRLDLAVGNPSTDGVTILMGDGSGGS
jgi:parallel beta-helix repeat protein